MRITAASFPTPHLALRTTDEDKLRRVGRFGEQQAHTAEAILPELTDALCTTRKRADRIAALTGVHGFLIRWRAELAHRQTERLGIGLPHDASRFTLSLREGGPNFDRIGYVGRLRENPVWDPDKRGYYGGRSTPAHEIMLAYGRIAEARFAAEAPDDDTLRNLVTLPDGTTIEGNSLVRGVAAHRAAAILEARIRRRGITTSHIEIGGDPMYAVTADDDNRERMFHAAMTLLADADFGDLGAWQAARYLLYQSPMTKKGSDAVTRVFLVATGTVLLGQPPVLDHDIDLRCAVLGQAAATTAPSDPRTVHV